MVIGTAVWGGRGQYLCGHSAVAGKDASPAASKVPASKFLSINITSLKVKVMVIVFIHVGHVLPTSQLPLGYDGLLIHSL